MFFGVPAMTGGDWATIEGVHTAADGFWQWLMELPQSWLGLRQRLQEVVKSLREFRQWRKESGND
jgi:hypothetical protein